MPFIAHVGGRNREAAAVRGRVARAQHRAVQQVGHAGQGVPFDARRGHVARVERSVRRQELGQVIHQPAVLRAFRQVAEFVGVHFAVRADLIQFLLEAGVGQVAEAGRIYRPVGQVADVVPAARVHRVLREALAVQVLAGQADGGYRRTRRLGLRLVQVGHQAVPVQVVGTVAVAGRLGAGQFQQGGEEVHQGRRGVRHVAAGAARIHDHHGNAGDLVPQAHLAPVPLLAHGVAVVGNHHDDGVVADLGAAVELLHQPADHAVGEAHAGQVAHHGVGAVRFGQDGRRLRAVQPRLHRGQRGEGAGIPGERFVRVVEVTVGVHPPHEGQVEVVGLRAVDLLRQQDAVGRPGVGRFVVGPHVGAEVGIGLVELGEVAFRREEGRVRAVDAHAQEEGPVAELGRIVGVGVQEAEGLVDHLVVAHAGLVPVVQRTPLVAVDGPGHRRIRHRLGAVVVHPVAPGAAAGAVVGARGVVVDVDERRVVGPAVEDLAHRGGEVARRILEDLRQEPDRLSAEVGPHVPVVVLSAAVDPRVLRQLAAQHAQARGRALRHVGVRVGEGGAAFGQAVQPGRGALRVAAEVAHVVAQVVNDDEEDVGPAGIGGLGVQAGGRQQGGGQDDRSGCKHGERERVRPGGGRETEMG